MYRERWSYLHLENRRDEILREFASLPSERRAAADAVLAGPDEGLPFRAAARAQAAVRGVAADDAFVLRAAVSAFVLPEVCDPEAVREECRTSNVSVFLPAPLPIPGRISFDVRVFDSRREERFRHRIEGVTELADLRMGRASVRVPCGEFADGAYEVEVRTELDGAGPRASDPVLRWTCHVLRGYQQRAEAAMARANELAAKLPPIGRSVLVGAAGLVGRAYIGEAFAVRSDGVEDLSRLERGLATLTRGEPLGVALGESVPLSVAVADGQSLACVLRRSAAEGPRPLVVIVGGMPAYDLSGLRPTAPTSRDPAWLAHQLAGFAVGRSWHVAFVESPGGCRDYGASLDAMLGLLGEIVPIDGKPVLIADREAATIVGLRAHTMAERVRGLVLVGGGAIPGNLLERVGGLPIRYARVTGAPANEAMQRTIDFAAKRAAAGTEPTVQWLDEAQWAWPLALPLRAAACDEFAAQCFAR